jgi:hypothetical protein
LSDTIGADAPRDRDASVEILGLGAADAGATGSSDGADRGAAVGASDSEGDDR